MTKTKLEKAIYLAENLPRGEYEVGNRDVYANRQTARPNKELLSMEWNRYDECDNLVIDADYRELMASGAELIRYLLGLLVECRKLFWEDHDSDMSAALHDALIASRDYDYGPPQE